MSEVLKNQHQESTFGVRSCVYVWQPCDSNIYSLTQRIQHRSPKAFTQLNPSSFKIPDSTLCLSAVANPAPSCVMGEQRLRLPLHNMEQFMRTQDLKNTRERLQEVIWLTEQSCLTSWLYVSQTCQSVHKIWKHRRWFCKLLLVLAQTLEQLFRKLSIM